MGGRVTRQALLDALVSGYEPHSGNLREQAAELTDAYGDLLRQRGGEPSADELRCVFGVAITHLERQQCK